MLRHLIFDFDGLIADTETAIYQAWRELYQSQGQDLPLETYVQCVGSTFHTYDPMAELERLTGQGIDWEPLLERKDARIAELHRQMRPLPGVRELLEEARSLGVECAVASSSQESWVIPWLDRLELRTFFRHICCRDEATRPKPAPDLFLQAMERLGTDPHHAMVLEDSANGLRAALAANVPCFIVPNEITRLSDFTGAAGILPTLEGASIAELSRVVEKFTPAI